MKAILYFRKLNTRIPTKHNMDIIQVDTSSWKSNDCFSREHLIHNQYSMEEILMLITGLTFDEYIRMPRDILDHKILMQVAIDFETGSRYMLRSPADDILLMLLLLHVGEYNLCVDFDKKYDNIILPAWMKKFIMSKRDENIQLIDYYMLFLAFMK